MRTRIIKDTEDLIAVEEARQVKSNPLLDDYATRIWQQLMIHSIQAVDFHGNIGGSDRLQRMHAKLTEMEVSNSGWQHRKEVVRDYNWR